MKLIDRVKVESLIGRLHFQQAAMITDIDEQSTQIPLILLNPTAVTSPLVQLQSQNLIQMSDDITVHVQCIASIVGHFRWSKVSVIYEQDGAFTLNSWMITTLSDALKSVDATIEQYKAFQHRASSGWDPSTIFICAEESLKRNLSKLVLAPWLFLILMLTANFTATLTSKLTVTQLQPSAADIETLRRDNAVIGCDRLSFTCHYLVNVLQIKHTNVREIRLMDDYPGAFQRGEIKAAAFVTEHANVFLAKYCKGFTLAGPTFTFGGLGFAFQKESPLTADVSRAILSVIEGGELGNMEKEMLSHYNCSSPDATNNDTSGLGFRPFSSLFYISGGIATTAFLMTIIPQMKKMLSFMVGLLFRERISDETRPENEVSNHSS